MESKPPRRPPGGRGSKWRTQPPFRHTPKNPPPGSKPKGPWHRDQDIPSNLANIKVYRLQYHQRLPQSNREGHPPRTITSPHERNRYPVYTHKIKITNGTYRHQAQFPTPNQGPPTQETERPTLPTYVEIPRVVPWHKLLSQLNYAGALSQEPTSSPAQVHQRGKEPHLSQRAGGSDF